MQTENNTDVCDQCGCAIDFPYEWCVCGLPERQRAQLENMSLQWFIRERELSILKREVNKHEH
jgi:hypothetical protein